MLSNIKNEDIFALPLEVMDKAEEFIETLNRLCIDGFNLVPTNRNTLQFEYEKGEYYVEFEIFSDEIGYLEMSGDSVIAEKIVTQEEILSILNNM